jgi:hypothetical protein
MPLLFFTPLQGLGMEASEEEKSDAGEDEEEVSE